MIHLDYSMDYRFIVYNYWLLRFSLTWFNDKW